VDLVEIKADLRQETHAINVRQVQVGHLESPQYHQGSNLPSRGVGIVIINGHFLETMTRPNDNTDWYCGGKSTDHDTNEPLGAF
jgi:hypothetical protein